VITEGSIAPFAKITLGKKIFPTTKPKVSKKNHKIKGNTTFPLPLFIQTKKNELKKFKNPIWKKATEIVFFTKTKKETTNNKNLTNFSQKEIDKEDVKLKLIPDKTNIRNERGNNKNPIKLKREIYPTLKPFKKTK
jgi:hypothetical protein